MIAIDLRLMRGPDAERHADGHRGGGGGDDQHQRLDGLLPQALVDDEEQAERTRRWRAPWSAAGTRRAARSRRRQHRRQQQQGSTRPSSRKFRPSEKPRNMKLKLSVRKSKNALPQAPIGIFTLARNLEIGSILLLPSVARPPCHHLVTGNRKGQPRGLPFVSIVLARWVQPLSSERRLDRRSGIAAVEGGDAGEPWRHGIRICLQPFLRHRRWRCRP